MMNELKEFNCEVSIVARNQRLCRDQGRNIITSEGSYGLSPLESACEGCRGPSGAESVGCLEKAECS